MAKKLLKLVMKILAKDKSNRVYNWKINNKKNYHKSLNGWIDKKDIII